MCMIVGSYFLFFFFFSSRRRHTRCYRDWSSDVCSSDLYLPELPCQPPFPHIDGIVRRRFLQPRGKRTSFAVIGMPDAIPCRAVLRFQPAPELSRTAYSSPDITLRNCAQLLPGAPTTAVDILNPPRL